MSRMFACPGCGSEELEAVSDGELTNFFCAACHRCWHVELGWFHRMDPSTCLGCPHAVDCGAVSAA